MARFLKSDAASPWASEFAGLTPGSKEFSDKWIEVASRDHDKFLAAQHEYIKQTYYEPLSQKARQTWNKCPKSFQSTSKRNLVNKRSKWC